MYQEQIILFICLFNYMNYNVIKKKKQLEIFYNSHYYYFIAYKCSSANNGKDASSGPRIMHLWKNATMVYVFTFLAKIYIGSFTT